MRLLFGANAAWEVWHWTAAVRCVADCVFLPLFAAECQRSSTDQRPIRPLRSEVCYDGRCTCRVRRECVVLVWFCQRLAVLCVVCVLFTAHLRSAGCRAVDGECARAAERQSADQRG